MPNEPKFSAADESTILNLIMQNCAHAILAAAELQRWRFLFPDDVSGQIGRESRRGELGRELGKLTATISAVMGTGIPDRDFGLEGMTRGQSEANQLLQRIIAKGGAA